MPTDPLTRCCPGDPLAISALLERFALEAPRSHPVLVLVGAGILAGFARMLDQRRVPLARPLRAA